MTRSERIQPIKNLADDREREAGLGLSRTRATLEEAEKQLADLIAYRADYVVRQHQGGAMDIARMQNFQAFLARLEVAISQQRRVVDDARRSAEQSASEWQERRIESAQLGKAVLRMKAEEVRVGERREQAQTDERAAQASRERLD